MVDKIEALARVIDPDAWIFYDEAAERFKKEAKAVLKNSKMVAQRIIDSGLMTSYEWDRKEYMSARERILDRTSREGYCYSVEDGLDGYFMHDPRCPRWPEGAIGGSRCIKAGSR